MYQLETRKVFFLLISLLLGPKHCHINALLYFLSKFIYHHYLSLRFVILRTERRSPGTGGIHAITELQLLPSFHITTK